MCKYIFPFFVQACSELEEDGKCVKRCRGVEMLNSQTSRLRPVADPSYQYERHCVPKCPGIEIFSVKNSWCIPHFCSSPIYLSTLSTHLPCRTHRSRIWWTSKISLPHDLNVISFCSGSQRLQKLLQYFNCSDFLYFDTFNRKYP